MNEFEYKEEYSWLTNACLNLTDDCCLACRYCFVEQHPHYMSYDVAQAAVLYLLDNLEKKNKKFGTDEKVNITYFGGEPTLMWDEIIVPLTNWIRKENFPINLNITTNGVLLNKERIQFLKDNEIYPLLSIDGNRETQEFNRPCKNGKSSFDEIITIIPDLLEAFPQATFRSTIYAPTVQYTFKNYVFAIEQGFQNIFMIPDSRHLWTKEQKKILGEEVNKIFSFIDFCFVNNKLPINFSTINDTYEEILKRDLSIYNKQKLNKSIKRQVVRCGLGTGMGSIGYDGKIYGCQEQDSKNISNIFYIGDIFNGINKKKHEKLLKKYNQGYQIECNNKILCENCPLKNTCINTDCPSSTWDLYKNFKTTTEINCIWRQDIFWAAIALNNKLIEENNQVFKYYLDNICKYNTYLKEER